MKCPGQDSRYWKPGAIFDVKCPQCAHVVEFFKDDTSRKCDKCGHRFVNPKMDFGCAAYCEFAEQCLGTLPPELVAQKEDLFKDRVALEMKRYFKSDFKRIGHAMKVARLAERIGKAESGSLAVILCAAYLHDIGIPESERKYNSSAARYQEKEGPPIAKRILEGLGAKAPLIDEVCDIIGHHHHPGDKESTNFKAVYDADLIVNMEETAKDKPTPAQWAQKIKRAAFLTPSGRKEAEKSLASG